MCPVHGLVFGVFAGLITAAFSFILSLNSPVYRLCDACRVPLLSKIPASCYCCCSIFHIEHVHNNMNVHMYTLQCRFYVVCHTIN